MRYSAHLQSVRQVTIYRYFKYWFSVVLALGCFAELDMFKLNASEIDQPIESKSIDDGEEHVDQDATNHDDKTEHADDEAQDDKDHHDDHSGHHAPKKVHGGDYLALLGPGREFMDVHPKLLIWTVLIFLVTWFLLGNLVWKPVLKVMNAREHRIEESLSQAEEIRRKTEELRESNRSTLKKAHDEAKKLIEEARESALVDCQSQIAAAQDKASKRQAEAVKEIEEAAQVAKESLNDQIEGLAKSIVSHVTGSQGGSK